MCRPVHPLRPNVADRECRFTSFYYSLVLLIIILVQVKCIEISKLERLPNKFANKNSYEDPDYLDNEVLINNEENDEFYIGYSGYLRSSSSMLTHPMRYNLTDNILYSKANVTFETKGHRRLKRAVTHLYNMIVCATGCNPLAYKGYGCYCGFLGSGYPMDGIDRCCKMHDWCYDATDCPMFVEYFVPYYWKCYRGYKPICAIEHGEWGTSGSCAQRLCECDRSFSECLRRYRCPRHKAVCTSSPWRLIQNLFMII